MNDIDLVGLRFGKLTVIAQSERIGKKKYKGWICKCDCGNEKSIIHHNLIHGKSKSCGCVQGIKLKKHSTTHGESGTRLHRIWKAMRQRCNNVNTPSYKYYGARGIKLCSEWQDDYLNFKNWAIENNYKDNLSIDRIDPNKGYYPKNCTWVTFKEQQNNKRNSFFITVNGEKLTVSQVAQKNNINQQTLYSKFYRLIKSINIPLGRDVEIKINYK